MCFTHLFSSFVHFSVPFTPTQLSIFFGFALLGEKPSLSDGTPRSSLIFAIDFFFLVFLRALSGDGMSQLVPATEGECERWSNRTVIRKEQEKKKLRERIQRGGGGRDRRGL